MSEHNTGSVQFGPYVPSTNGIPSSVKVNDGKGGAKVLSIPINVDTREAQTAASALEATLLRCEILKKCQEIEKLNEVIARCFEVWSDWNDFIAIVGGENAKAKLQECADRLEAALGLTKRG